MSTLRLAILEDVIVEVVKDHPNISTDKAAIMAAAKFGWRKGSHGWATTLHLVMKMSKSGDRIRPVEGSLGHRICRL